MAFSEKYKEPLAVKIMRKSEMNKRAIARLVREVDIHIRLNDQHPHVVRTYEIIETVDHVYIFMEFCQGGELLDKILASDSPTHAIPEDEAAQIFAQIVSAVQYIHEKGVVHRDIKAENVLLDFAGNAKLIDFGLGTIVSDAVLMSRVGSPHYAAPEMLTKQGYTKIADVFSLGVLLFVMLTRRFPFDDPNDEVLARKKLNREFKVPFWVSPDANDLLWKMLSPDPEKRIPLTEIASHKFFSNKKKLVPRGHSPHIFPSKSQPEKAVTLPAKSVRSNSGTKLPMIEVDPPSDVPTKKKLGRRGTNEGLVPGMRSLWKKTKGMMGRSKEGSKGSSEVSTNSNSSTLESGNTSS